MPQQLNIRTATHIWESEDRSVAVPVFMFELRQAPAWPTPTGEVETTWNSIVEEAGLGLVLDPSPASILQSAPIVSQHGAWIDLRSPTSLTLYLSMPVEEDGGTIVMKIEAAGSHQIGTLMQHDQRFRSLVAQQHRVFLLYGMGLNIELSPGQRSGEADIVNAVRSGNLFGGWVRAVS
ncbi:hypothetical protein QUG92_15775 [Curtobacterium sp. RHCKG23]|uniref:Uncharacterized protein n=1 Tax=Curtobacterium citri TaxID=3055139 RepID=A0ABT7TAG1_9MICO|nr:hypothetical protein [Curtobacterium citri]MDM7886570.1 hypothetical protein [Curtobacterium citri]